MTRTHQSLALCGLFLVGLWGCTQSGNEKAQLESRLAKVEEDLKTTQASRDTLKSRLGLLEEVVRAETERRQLVEKEREDLAARLRRKAAEKDAVVGHYDDLVTRLESVLGEAKVIQTRQADAAEGKVPATTTARPKK